MNATAEHLAAATGRVATFRDLTARSLELIERHAEHARGITHARETGDMDAFRRAFRGAEAVMVKQRRLETRLRRLFAKLVDDLDAIAVSRHPPYCIHCGTFHEPGYPHIMTGAFCQFVRQRTGRQATREDTYRHCRDIIFEAVQAVYGATS